MRWFPWRWFPESVYRTLWLKEVRLTNQLQEDAAQQKFRAEKAELVAYTLAKILDRVQLADNDTLTLEETYEYARALRDYRPNEEE